MTPSERFLHLASGDGAAEIIGQTLELLGRDEAIVAMRDDYAEGPLKDAASRVAWWSKLRGAPLAAAEAAELDDADLWARVRASADDVVLWHGPHAMERIFALRACWHLRAQPQRLHEVVVQPSGAVWADGLRPAFYDAVALSRPNEIAAAWSRRAKVLNVEDRARRWEELRERDGEWVRVLDGDAIVHLPVTAYDAELVSACKKGDWTRTRFVLGWVLTDHATSEQLLCWRIRELVRAGALEGRGVDDALRLPEQVRPMSAIAG